MKKRNVIIAIISIAAVALAIALILLPDGKEPCVFSDKIAFGMSRAAAEKKLGPADGVSGSDASGEMWDTYQTTYEDVPAKVTLTFLPTGASERLIGISLQTEAPMETEAAATVAEKMIQQIRAAYQQRSGYYERANGSVFELGVEEGATGFFFTIEQQATAIVAQGRRLS